jgi:hypothetical protein
MEPRKEGKQVSKAPEVRKKEPRLRLQIVKLEERIAPKLAVNHNETLVPEPAKSKAKAPEVRKKEPRPRLQIIKLEERIAPRHHHHLHPIAEGMQLQHNETLVRDRSPRAR